MELLKANRHEIKYTISTTDSIVLSNRLSKVLKKDKNCTDGAYTITSLYFDDINNSAYTQKVNGDPIRHKYRIRYYNNNTSFFKLERKSKFNQMIAKVSGELNENEVKNICNGDFEFLREKKEDLFMDFYLKLSHGLIKPKVLVKYKRLAFVHPVGDVRITFDSKLMTSNNQTDIFNENTSYKPAIGINDVIMEIKFNNILPDHIKGLIQTGNVMASANSKYVYSRKYNYEF